MTVPFDNLRVNTNPSMAEKLAQSLKTATNPSMAEKFKVAPSPLDLSKVAPSPLDLFVESPKANTSLFIEQ